MRRSYRVWGAALALGLLFLLSAGVDLSAAAALPALRWAPRVRWGLAIGGGTRLTFHAVPLRGVTLDQAAMASTQQLVARRLNGLFDAPEPVVLTTDAGDTRGLAVELPGAVADAQLVARNIAATGWLTIVGNGPTYLFQGAPVPARIPVLARSADVAPGSVSVSVDSTGQPSVDLQVRQPAASRVERYSAAHVGQHVAVALDDIVVADSTIVQPFPRGVMQLSGFARYEDAARLAMIVRYGPLPVALYAGGAARFGPRWPVSAAGALLAWAAAVLLAAAIVGSIVRGVAGLGAVMAMAMHATVLAAMAAVFSLPLTVSGLAGYALAVAIGFDYAVVVFQRKGERRQAATRAGDAPIVAGLAPRLAIRDSGLATLLICAALWWVGAPSVTPLLSDFASTLFVGLCGVTATTALLAAIVLPVGRDEIADAGAAVFDRSGGLAYAPSGRGQEGK